MIESAYKLLAVILYFEIMAKIMNKKTNNISKKMNMPFIKAYFFGNDTRKALSVSTFFHILILLIILISFLKFPDEEIIKKSESVLSFNLAAPSDEANEATKVPQLAPPKPLKNVEGEFVEEKEASDSSFSFGLSGGGNIWTPPPPPDARTGATSPEGLDRSRIILPKITFNGLGTDPVLISYDIGLYTGSEALIEAARLNKTGRMKMVVQISEEGIPLGCTVIETTGSTSLDNLGCGLIMTYKYEPALDNREKPKQAVIYEILEWLSDNGENDFENIKRPDYFIDENEDGISDELLVEAKPITIEDGDLINVIDSN